MEQLLALVAVVAIVLIWLDSTRAREVARTTAARLCGEAGVQLLDQTVALERAYPLRTASGLRIGRDYGFEFSEDGASRRRGSLRLVGTRLREAVFDGERIGRLIVPGGRSGPAI